MGNIGSHVDLTSGVTNIKQDSDGGDVLIPPVWLALIQGVAAGPGAKMETPADISSNHRPVHFVRRAEMRMGWDLLTEWHSQLCYP